ncbi:MAG: hypothetical protein RR595_05615 [Lysinibacillus sp.]
MEKIKEFIAKTEEQHSQRNELGRKLLATKYSNYATSEFIDQINGLKKLAEESGVLSVGEKDGVYTVQLAFEVFSKIVNDPQPVSVRDDQSSIWKHYKTTVDGIHLTSCLCERKSDASI